MLYVHFVGVFGCIFVLQSAFVVSARILDVSYQNISTLHQFVENSYHKPLCVIFKTDSQLERRILKLWESSEPSKDSHPSSWILAGVNTTQVKKLPRYLLRESHSAQSSFLRCFLAPTLSHDLHLHASAPPTTKHLRKWLRHLVALHDQLVNGGVDMIEASVSVHLFTMVVFPTPHQHEEVERAAFQVMEALSSECSINTIVIHPSSAHLKTVLERYQVSTMPSVLVIQKETGRKQQQTVFNIHDVMTGRMEADMRAALIPAPRLTLSEFKADVLKISSRERYRPYLVGFYAHWEKGTAVFLSFLFHTVLEFKSLGADVRFGLVDASRNPEVVSHYMSPTCLQHLPFLAVFHAEEGQATVNQTELLVTRPTPYTVFTALREAGLALTDSHQQPIRYQPYGHNAQVCLWMEGPQGDRCSSDNTTWSFETDALRNPSDCHTTQDTIMDGRKAETKYRIPLATPVDLQFVGKTSDGDQDNLTVFINILIFIKQPCKSCEENQPLFYQIYELLSANDGVRVRLINCSRTAAFCERHHVTGFPSVLAFRRHTPPAKCGAACSKKSDCVRSVRQDYHGVLTKEALMAWVASVSISSVQSLQFSKPFWTKRESAQLIATVVPADSGFLPLPPHKNKGYFYSARCFREVCERLFGLVACFTVYSPDVPTSQFDNNKTVDLVVSQIDFRRHDGIEVTLMQLGPSLADLLEEETDNALHMFHTHHSYDLLRKQKCEDDHGRCTLFLESFARDHMRLPVTPLTSDILHSNNEFLFGDKAPILLALVEENYSAEFQKMLENIAYAFYKDVVVATLDVTGYRAWAGSFVPRDYNKLHAELPSWGELGVYPRFCMFYWYDHTRAAFHPPVQSTLAAGQSTSLNDVDDQLSSASSDVLSEESVAGFVRRFLRDPASCLVETEKF